MPENAPLRQLGLTDCIAIGVNGVVGSGIYFLIAPLANTAGPASIVGVAACGVLCTLIALCFAELASSFDRSGGAYVYAQEAFGRVVGFAVGWMSLCTGVIAFAASAAGFAELIVGRWPAFAARVEVGPFALGLGPLLAAAVICALGWLNLRGVKAGARTLDALTVVKLLPLIALAVLGLFALRGEVVAEAVRQSVDPSRFGALAGAAFLSVFMMSGFEFTAVPAGEVKNARRNVPIAVVASIVGATALYCVLMGVVFSVHDGAASSQQPIPEAAGRLFGAWAQRGFTAVSAVSMLAFCAGSALVAPRYVLALADDGYLPSRLSTVGKAGVPAIAILVTAALAAALCLVMDFSSLVDITNLVMFAQYLPATLAVLVLRRTRTAPPGALRLPLGPIIPVLAAGLTVLLFVSGGPKLSEWIFAAQLLALGVAVWVGAQVWMRRTTRL